MDASTKIYGFRVDVVYNDTFKLASGLTQSSKQKVPFSRLFWMIISPSTFEQTDESLDGSNVEGEEGATAEGEGLDNQEGAKKRKRIKKSATVEKNLKNINIGKMELEFDVDPLFKKTTSQFDAAGKNPPRH